ncbi:MAG: BrnA antitoxin family protein [Patescibacteria group bacterium]|nr:BrnA antitoxin family protein [Patescibacteria group bacterium]MCL5431952.1 BrnA antitoxin family protein [Patescibacteria group bacterium]
MSNFKILEPDESIFRDREKEAAFWEKNIKQVRATAKPIKVKFAKNLSATLNIRLDPQTLHNVRSQASKKGLGPTQLIRMWIMEKMPENNNFQSAGA